MAHTYVYEPHGGAYERKVDKKRCRASVHDDFGVGSHQCTRDAKVFDKEKLGWCTQHSPEADAKRRAKRQAKWDAESERDRRRYLALDVGRAWVAAMEEDGNQARAAGVALAAWEKSRHRREEA